MKLTTEQFIEKAKQIHGDKYDYSLVEYVNNDTKVKIICKIHGIFEQKPRSHLSSKGCCECGKKLKKDKLTTLNKARTKTTEQFIEKAKQIHGDKYDYSLVEYKGANTKVKIICNKCKNIFSIIPRYHFLVDGGCNICAIQKVSDLKRLSQEEVLKRCEERKEYDCSKIKYIDAYTKIEIVCKKHGSFWMLPYNFYGIKQNCPKCKIESSLEKKTEAFLKNKNIVFEVQKKFPDLKDKRYLSYDFFIPDKNILIECQGLQHFKPVEKFGGGNSFIKQLYHDKLKKEYAKSKGYKLIEILFDDNVEEELSKIF